MKKTVALLVLCTLGLVAADNPFVGTWKLNVAKSTFNPGPAPQSETVVIRADNKVQVTGADANGQAQKWSYTYTQGTAATITGVPDATVTETRKGHTTDQVWKIGKGMQTGHGVISKDGKTMNYTITGTDADGKPASGTSVYEKQ
ncbi:MAG: hypothetical protein WBW33_08215 [Bryobacteraceae bacterium]